MHPLFLCRLQSTKSISTCHRGRGTSCLYPTPIDALSRWQHIINRYLPEFDRMKAFIVKTEIAEFGSVGPWFAAVIKASFAGGWRLVMPPELSEELEGIADITTKHGLDYKTLLLLNLGYDLVARCTSIVVPAVDGTPCLLRNMDWESPVLHATTIDVEFVSGGQTLYRVRPAPLAAV